MEDLEQPDSPTIDSHENEPQGNQDPNDPLRPELEEENNAAGTPPMADPYADMEAQHDEMPTNGANGDDEEGMNDEEHDSGNPANTDAAVRNDDDDDDESDLEELDEQQFEDFDPEALNIPDKPIEVDGDNVGLLGVHKRKRTAEEEAERERKKKKKEKRREKPSRKKKGGDEDDFEGGVEIDGKRQRKSKVGADGRPVKSAKRAATPVDEESLTPEERRRRALDRKMDEALKSNRVSRKKATADLEERADQEISDMRNRIAKACEADAQARARGDVATHKLKILPEVVELMNRNTIQAQLVDPDINILESIRFMLEPADQDAALPNYQIQRELFAILNGRLKIGKDALVASQIGKVVLFYTKSIQPQPDIKRQAEQLVAEWTRVILNKGKDARSGPVETRAFDPLLAASQRSGPSQADRVAQLAEKRKKALAAPGPSNRARVEGGVGTYTVAPVSNLSNAQGQSQRKTQGANDEHFRRIAARSSNKAGGGGRR